MRTARVSTGPVTIHHGGETFEFGEGGTRQVTQKEEDILSTYRGRHKITFEGKHASSPKKTTRRSNSGTSSTSDEGSK